MPLAQVWIYEGNTQQQLHNQIFKFLVYSNYVFCNSHQKNIVFFFKLFLRILYMSIGLALFSSFLYPSNSFHVIPNCLKCIISLFKLHICVHIIYMCIYVIYNCVHLYQHLKWTYTKEYSFAHMYVFVADCLWLGNLLVVSYLEKADYSFSSIH